MVYYAKLLIAKLCNSNFTKLLPAKVRSRILYLIYLYSLFLQLMVYALLEYITMMCVMTGCVTQEN